MIQSTVNLMLGAAFAALLVFAAVRDVKTHMIPNLICTAIAVLAVPRMIWGGLNPLYAAGGLLVAGLPLIVMYFVKKGSAGGGDVKLCAASGLFLGVEGAAAMLFLSNLVFCCVQKYRQHKGIIKAGAIAPFGPYIAGSGIITFILMIIGG